MIPAVHVTTPWFCSAPLTSTCWLSVDTVNACPGPISNPPSNEITPVVHVIGAAVCNCPEPVTVALSSVGTVSVRSPVTVVVPFMCSVPVPLKVDPLSSVTFPRVNVVPAPTVKCPLDVSAVVTLRVPLCSSIVPVLVNRTQLPNTRSPLPAVLRNVPALVKVGVPHRLDQNV